MPRNRTDRKIVRAAELQLKAIRDGITPEVITLNIKALENIRDTSKDMRARNTAVKILQEMLNNQLDRDIPQEIDHNIYGEVVTKVVEEVIHTHEGGTGAGNPPSVDNGAKTQQESV